MNKEDGRSMVEMLGVLAIIGVLSAGALAGYSKAMYQHKLNIHKTSFDLLLANSIALSEKMDQTASTNYNIGSSLYSMNLIPDNMTYSNSYIYDIFKNPIRVYIRGASYQDYKGGVWVYLKISDENIGACANMVKSAQEISSEIYLVERTKRKDNGSNTYAGNLYGDKYCSSSPTQCLKNLTQADILKLCQYDGNTQDQDTFSLFIIWK